MAAADRLPRHRTRRWPGPEPGEPSITAHDLGARESPADGRYHVPADDGRRLAFIGDVAIHGAHPYTADGHTSSWIDVLDRLGNDLAGTRCLLPGHRLPTGVEVLTDQRRHLLSHRELVRRLAAGPA